MVNTENVSSYLPSQSELGKKTVLNVFGAVKNKCGYCKTESRSSVLYGVSASQHISCELYEELINRGWRRSGRFVYKPLMQETCCPQHPIRLRASCFIPKKQQRAVMRKLDQYLATGTHRLKLNSNCKSSKRRMPTNSITTQCTHPSGSSATTLPPFVFEELSKRIRNAVITACQNMELPEEFSSCDALRSAGEVRFATKRAAAKFHEASCPPPDLCCTLPLKLAGMLNSSKRNRSSKCNVRFDDQAKHIGEIIVQQLHVPEWANVIISKNGYMNIYLNNNTVKEVVNRANSAVCVDKRGELSMAESKAQKELDLEEDVMYDDSCAIVSDNNELPHDMAVAVPDLSCHSISTTLNPPSNEQNPRLNGGGPGPSHVLSVSTVKAVVTDEVHQLYQKYQIAVHGDTPDECSRAQFEGFIVESPLSSDSNDSPPLVCSAAVGNTNDIVSNDGKDFYIPCGTYHQHYRIDGQLVAVGVIDILPRSLSSVYCFYDPAFRFLSLGKVVAMKEINWVQRCQQVRPNMQYYCLGYYVHSCPKMSYKGEYAPAELLSPSIPGLWIPLDHCKPLLDADKHDRLQLVGNTTNSSTPEKSVDLTAKGEAMEHAINSVLFLSKGNLFTFGSLPLRYQRLTMYRCVAQFVRMVGPDMAQRFVLNVSND